MSGEWRLETRTKEEKCFAFLCVSCDTNFVDRISGSLPFAVVDYTGVASA